jgi:hypothetical protein
VPLVTNLCDANGKSGAVAVRNWLAFVVPRTSYGCRMFVRFDLGRLRARAALRVTRAMRNFRWRVRKRFRHNTCNAATFTALAVAMAEDLMLHKCANPDCSAQFLHMTQGKLFVVEKQAPRRSRSGPYMLRAKSVVRQIEHYWLCDDCSRFLTLVFDPRRGTRTIPLPAMVIKKTVLSVTRPGIPVRIERNRPLVG